MEGSRVVVVLVELVSGWNPEEDVRLRRNVMTWETKSVIPRFFAAGASLHMSVSRKSRFLFLTINPLTLA